MGNDKNCIKVVGIDDGAGRAVSLIYGQDYGNASLLAVDTDENESHSSTTNNG